MTAAWKNRIVGEDMVNPANLSKNPQNWRLHPALQAKALGESLETLGWIQRPIVNKTTGHLLDGHLRVDTAIERREKQIPVLYVELSEEEERLALATLDPISALAAPDCDRLVALLGKLDAPGPGLEQLLEDLAVQADSGALKAFTGASGAAAGSKSVLDLVKIVVAITEVSVIEEAIAATGCLSRGEAIAKICTSYLETRKHDADAQADVAIKRLKARR